MRKMLFVTVLFSALATAALALGQQQARAVVRAWMADSFPLVAVSTQPETRAPASEWARALIGAAEAQVGVTTIYDGSYQSLSYPGGDVAAERGVCTDVIIRALRTAHGIDLQKAVHEDMKRAFSKYPRIWGLKRPDRNIDHRRVPNLRRFLVRRGAELPVSSVETDFFPGDLVTWTLGPGLPHIGIVSDRLVPGTSRPYIIHNIGAGTQVEDILFAYPMTGHYRPEGKL